MNVKKIIVAILFITITACGSSSGSTTDSLLSAVQTKITDSGKTFAGNTLTQQINGICDSNGYDSSNTISLATCMTAIATGTLSLI